MLTFFHRDYYSSRRDDRRGDDYGGTRGGTTIGTLWSLTFSFEEVSKGRREWEGNKNSILTLDPAVQRLLLFFFFLVL